MSQQFLEKCLLIKIMYPFINRRSTLNLDNKLIIYKVIFQALMLYGAPVWAQCAVSHINKLQVMQNKILKMILNLPRHFSTLELRSRANVMPISVKLRIMTDKFYEKCSIIDNPLIRQLATYQTRSNCRLE